MTEPQVRYLCQYVNAKDCPTPESVMVMIGNHAGVNILRCPMHEVTMQETVRWVIKEVK